MYDIPQIIVLYLLWTELRNILQELQILLMFAGLIDHLVKLFQLKISVQN